MDKYVLFTVADFPVFLAEMAIKGGYGNFIFLHDKSLSGLYISPTDAKKTAEAGLKLYSNAKAIDKLIKKGHSGSKSIKAFLARHPATSFKRKTPAELKRALFEYYAIGIPFLKIYSFTEGIYSPLIDKAVRNFVLKNTSGVNEAVRVFALLLNPAKNFSVASKRKKILKITAAPGLITTLCRSVRKMGKAKFVFRASINQSYVFLAALLNECAKRSYLSPAQSQACTLAETAAVLDGNEIDVNEINQRIKCCAAFQKNGRPEFLTGAAALKIINRLKFAIPEDITEFRGDPASAGRAAGRVSIVPVMMAKGGPAATREKIAKMRKGDILVANTTGPEMIMACRKAAAIVANEGGINSHAAIVSRELGIPGIVNTKIATSVLNDGDIIEVDADNGLVKIVKKTRKSD